MALEEKIVADVVGAGIKLAETAVKEVWSVLDAAAEKKPPSEQLSQTAIQAIQGIAPTPQK